MSASHIIAISALLVPLAIVITYYDVRYRRIPNAVVLATLISGLAINSVTGGISGALASICGCVLAFCLMFMLHVFGAMGAGDVKLFAAIGALIGSNMVLPTFLVITLVGGVLAVCATLRAGEFKETLYRVLQIFASLLPGWEMPRFTVPANRRHTIPYGVAITTGSLISLMLFHA